MCFNVQSLLLIAVILIISVHTDPIIIRSGLNKDHAEIEDTNQYDANKVKGISNYEQEAGFNTGNEKKIVQAADNGRYGEEASKKNLHSDENNYNDEKFHQKGGGHLSDYGSKVAHKKGHHKTGFTNSYHKDESGHSSTYYDDANDEGDEVVRNSNNNAYGDLGQQTIRGSHLDDNRYNQDNTKHGSYNNAGNYEKDLANHRDYRNRNYYNNNENQGVRNANNQYGLTNRHVEDNAVHRPYPIYNNDYYYDEPLYNRRASNVPKKTITIYEDPRYAEDYDNLERPVPIDDGYIQLDVKRPLLRDTRYFDQPPPYDYYY